MPTHKQLYVTTTAAINNSISKEISNHGAYSCQVYTHNSCSALMFLLIVVVFRAKEETDGRESQRSGRAEGTS